MLWARWRWWCCCSVCPKRRASPKTFSATSSSCTETPSPVRATRNRLHTNSDAQWDYYISVRLPRIPSGKVVKHLSLSLFGSRFLGSEDHAGFLYVRSTFQSLQGLPLPNQPFVFGLLVHRDEVAWAKAFPLRLMLRLGAEYRCELGSGTKPTRRRSPLP